MEEVLGTAFINVFVWIYLFSFGFLLLLLPKFSHSKQLEVGLVGSIFWKDVIIVLFPASIRLEKESTD